MKKILALVAALMFVIPTAACTIEAPPAAAPVTVTAEPAPEPQASSQDEQYLDTIRDESPQLNAVPDSSLVELAGNICTSLRSGIPIETVLRIGIESGLDSDSVTSIAAGAVVFYCPDAYTPTSGV
jgi:hypothetical protein